ncbi:MAG: SMC-Scp complex subunit ScpB [Phycisphaeraceae bacterium]|nr:SMC-Scp complex subunit ScpB [Phycisphaeraceae bacterium]
MEDAIVNTDVIELKPGPTEGEVGAEGAGAVGPSEEPTAKKRGRGARAKAVEVELGDPQAIAPALEAVLLTAERALSAARIAEVLGLGSPRSGKDEPEVTEDVKREPGAALVRRAVELLNEQYEQTGRSFRIEPVAGGFRVMTLAKFAPVVAAYQGQRAKTSLTPAAMETLAIIAYKQPLTRAKLEAIRGVACGDLLRSLIDRRLVTIAGRAEELGRPLLYATTRQFLEAFGLSGLKDLPTVEELKARTAEPDA